MKMQSLLLKTLAGMPLLMAGAYVHAIPVVGSSGGLFENLSSCDNSGSLQTCRITSSTNGLATQVEWGSQVPYNNYVNFVNPSRLTSVDLAINTNTSGGGLGVAIGRLDWYNSATLASSDLDQFGVSWTLSLAFSSPNGPDAFGSELFNLTINNTTNPAADNMRGLGLADLSGLRSSVTLNGVTISNLRYAVVDGSGWGTSSFSNNVWYNAENNWSSLYILADFRGSTSVPEPTSLALFGLGLLGTAVASRSRRRKQAA